jgi:multidrug efflux pump subunit AcrA (membrane-fusion protein)
VPRDAVHDLRGAKVVFVPAGGDRYRAVKVETGRSSPDEVEILSGLEAGQPVVTRGSFTLKAELSKASMGHAGHAH